MEDIARTPVVEASARDQSDVAQPHAEAHHLILKQIGLPRVVGLGGGGGDLHAPATHKQRQRARVESVRAALRIRRLLALALAAVDGAQVDAAVPPASMGRPKKSTVASRNNGANAKNKGKPKRTVPVLVSTRGKAQVVVKTVKWAIHAASACPSIISAWICHPTHTVRQSMLCARG